MQMFHTAPPTRLWTASPDHHWLVQTQDDRLLLNWRRLDGEGLYPGYDATIRPGLEALITQLERPGGDLIPLVAEYSYINRIDGTVPGLHETYSVFRKPTRPLPGSVVGERYEVVTNVPVDTGFAELTVSILPGGTGPASTTLTVSTKVFVGSTLPESRILEMVDNAHNVSKEAFFAIVSDDATSKWGASE
ncbi:hypothetical protein FBY40_1588 [Microbacterium sp. SLBN-154]|nr:hypothetical protein FBY40_1588 [Microbacterium sp. SLBN-154]